MTAGNFLRSLRGQSVSVLLALLVFLLLFFAAFRIGERTSQERAVVLASAAITEVTKADLVQRGERLATRFASNIATPLAAGDSACRLFSSGSRLTTNVGISTWAGLVSPTSLTPGTLGSVPPPTPLKA